MLVRSTPKPARSRSLCVFLSISHPSEMLHPSFRSTANSKASIFHTLTSAPTNKEHNLSKILNWLDAGSSFEYRLNIGSQSTACAITQVIF